MQRKAVVSSNVVSVGYNEEEKIYEVEFKGGSVYQYLDVPKEIVEQIKTSRSIGSAIAKLLISKYQTKKLK